jgi:uncharacterized membrane protein YphA (DoxX/SURF4 family)
VTDIASIVLAHEKWFVEPSPYPTLFDSAGMTRTLQALVISAAAIGIAFAVDRLWRARSAAPTPPDLTRSREDLRRLFAWIPLILALHVAVPLIVSGVQRQLFVPNLQLPFTFLGGLIGLVEIALALSFVYGILTRVAAAALMLLFPVCVVLFGLIDTLEHLELLGIAVFLMIFGRGPYSLDAIFGVTLRTPPEWILRAVPILRVLTGLAIAWLGFTEKLWNVPLGVAFLERYPFNFMPALGFGGFSNADFVVAAGFVEVAVGAVIASGLATRPVILVAWVPFNLTLPFMGWVELVGHLPMYGIMVVLLLWGGGRDVSPYLKDMEKTARSS